MKWYRVVFTDGERDIIVNMKVRNLNELYHRMDVTGMDVISYSRQHFDGSFDTTESHGVTK